MSKNTPDFKKCAYAGDPNDEFCSVCDGFYPLNDDGEPTPATECGGYDPEEEKVEEPKVEEDKEEPKEEYSIKGETTTIRAEYGVSTEVNGSWHKFTYSEERVLPVGCDVEKEKQNLWNAVLDEIDNQLSSL